MLCVLVSSGHPHSSYVDKYERITLRWGYRPHKVAHPGLHHTWRHSVMSATFSAVGVMSVRPVADAHSYMFVGISTNEVVTYEDMKNWLVI